jgi:hypothetical protein
MVLKFNQLVKPGITPYLGCKHAISKKSISATNIRWGVKDPPENIRICSKLNPTAPRL